MCTLNGARVMPGVGRHERPHSFQRKSEKEASGMVYLLVAVLLLTAWQLTLRARREGLLRVVKGLAVAAVFGLLAGVFIGLGARAGMAAITFANGGTPSITLAGSFTVVSTFSSYGIALGIVYEGLFRRLLRANGLAYGGLLMLSSWYPLAQAAAQQLTGQPASISLVITSGIVVALMWLPYGLTLEALLRRWQSRMTARTVANAAA
ncbi:MAG: hypothetical protein LC795_00215 [Acidobacteria bacterium]|nr:hypothetical protein [Acidobacteriota bacterium]